MYRAVKISGIFVFVLLCLQFAKAQNLIADSSFENNKFIPTLMSAINANAVWTAPTWGTTDLFCTCSKKQRKISEAQVPLNPMGYQNARSGKCYAGIYAFSHGDYREYLFTQLSMPLQATKSYSLSMYVSLADYSRVTVDQLGVCFLNNKITYANSEDIKGLSPVYVNIEKDIGSDTMLWHKITVDYIAHGGEMYLLIGSFAVNDIKVTNVKAPPGVRTRINQITERDAYYYFDDICLKEAIPHLIIREDTTKTVKPDTSIAVVTAEPLKEDTVHEEIVLDKPLILKNVLFETNEAVFLSSSYAELDLVVAHLTKNQNVKLEIAGHTDSKGNETQNFKLSEKRAKAVSDYLISKGIVATRLTYKGYGSVKPIAENETEEGRKQNRRVEFVFYE